MQNYELLGVVGQGQYGVAHKVRGGHSQVIVLLFQSQNASLSSPLWL